MRDSRGSRSAPGAKSGSITIWAWARHHAGHAFLEQRASSGQPLDVGLIYVHTSDSVAGDSMLADLARWYRVRRAVAHAFLANG